MKEIWFSLRFLIALTLAACVPDATPMVTPALPTATKVEPTAGPVCPEPGTGTQLLRNDEYSYCFLFPDGYVRLDPLPYEVCLVPEGPSMMCHGANLIIEVHEALGRTADQIADEKIAEHPRPDIIERLNQTVGGEDAVVVDGLSAVATSRNVFIVHEEQLYDLLFIPWDEAGDEFVAIETLYTTVMNSLKFVP